MKLNSIETITLFAFFFFQSSICFSIKGKDKCSRSMSQRSDSSTSGSQNRTSKEIPSSKNKLYKATITRVSSTEFLDCNDVVIEEQPLKRDSVILDTFLTIAFMKTRLGIGDQRDITLTNILNLALKARKHNIDLKNPKSDLSFIWLTAFDLDRLVRFTERTSALTKFELIPPGVNMVPAPDRNSTNYSSALKALEVLRIGGGDIPLQYLRRLAVADIFLNVPIDHSSPPYIIGEFKVLGGMCRASNGICTLTNSRRTEVGTDSDRGFSKYSINYPGIEHLQGFPARIVITEELKLTRLIVPVILP